MPRFILAGALMAFGLLVVRLVFPRILGPSSLWEPKHSSIRELEELPLGPVRLRGTVTYVDPVLKRFWLQDESGAIAINQDPAASGVEFGQQVLVETNKTHNFDPIFGLQSIALNQFRITLLQRHGRLPQPAPATVNALPESGKNGIQISIEGVLHRVARDQQGRTVLHFGESGHEIQAVVATTDQDFTEWIDDRVRIVGVSESVLNTDGAVGSRYLWIQNARQIRKIEDAPPSIPLYSVRTLYQARNNETGHRIRLHGNVVARTGNEWLVEDEWGTISCISESSGSIATGTAVEVTGFPLRNGLRTDLVYADIKPVSRRESKPSRESDLVPLTTVGAVKKLTEQQASLAIPVKISGVVTFHDRDYKQLFMQDSTGGIFIKYTGTPGISMGEKVTVIGLTNPGDYAPMIVAAKFVLGGKGNLPAPVPMTRDAWSGSMDGILVEVEGVIHPLRARQNPTHIRLDIATSFGRLFVSAGPELADLEYFRNLEDSKVRMRGVGTILFNSRRQLIGLQVMVSSRSDIRVLERGNRNPFTGPAVSIDKLLQFSPGVHLDHRVRVHGSVTMVGNGFFYVQDGTGGARIEGDIGEAQISDLVDAVGYVEPRGYSPVLTDARVKVEKHHAPVAVEEVTFENMGDGRFDAKLVSVEGTLVGVLNSPEATTLVLRGQGRAFDAVLYLPGSNETLTLPRVGSVLRLTGICSVQVGDSSVFQLLTKVGVHSKLVLRSPEDIQVLQPVSWWSTHRTVLLLGGLVIIVCISLIWIAILRTRVRRQGKALQKAKDKNEAISKFIGVMQDVRRNEGFTSRVPVQGDDDIGLLSAEFNHMLSELQVRDLAKSAAERKLQQQALTDELTGLPNRRLLEDRLSQSLELAQRDERQVAVLYLDLDGFKLVNDTLGHSAGDDLLRQVAQRLRLTIRKSDTLARVGGDEFTAVLSQLHAASDAALVANNLLKTMAQPFMVHGQEVTVGASLGISVFPDNGSNSSELLQQADTAMYCAKRNGKNQMMYFTPELGSSVRERSNLETQLRGAIGRGEICLHYQPEFDVQTRKLVRFEALARWTHPSLGMIPPRKFIPIAEDSGLIIPLGAFLLEKACKDAISWQKLSRDSIQVAVNISSLQFLHPGLLDEVAAILRRTGFNPNLLQLELTESATLKNPNYAVATMQQLQAMGISLAIDDFGTGYSCLNYLPRLPFNTLKIDRSFVRDVDQHPDMRAMIRSLIMLAHNLKMQVVVEGIETHEQLEMIQELGGDQVQGYFLGRPTPHPEKQILTRDSPTGTASSPAPSAFPASISSTIEAV